MLSLGDRSDLIQMMDAPLLQPMLRSVSQPAHHPVSASPLVHTVLNALAQSLLLVDIHGRVLHANLAARATLRDGAPLALSSGQLVLPAESEERLLAAVMAAARGQWSMLSLPDESGTPASAWPVAVVPLGQGPDRAGAVAMLVVGTGAMMTGLVRQFFVQTHGLTAAEAQVLTALCDGRTPAQVAEDCGVAISTVRTQVMALREKVRARSIRHLVQMVAGLPAIWGSGPTRTA